VRCLEPANYVQISRIPHQEHDLNQDFRQCLLMMTRLIAADPPESRPIKLSSAGKLDLAEQHGTPSSFLISASLPLFTVTPNITTTTTHQSTPTPAIMSSPAPVTEMQYMQPQPMNQAQPSTTGASALEAVSWH
jgi:hypothetical protein